VVYRRAASPPPTPQHQVERRLDCFRKPLSLFAGAATNQMPSDAARRDTLLALPGGTWVRVTWNKVKVIPLNPAPWVTLPVTAVVADRIMDPRVLFDYHMSSPTML
jgi:hypothetical protein